MINKSYFYGQPCQLWKRSKSFHFYQIFCHIPKQPGGEPESQLPRAMKQPLDIKMLKSNIFIFDPGLFSVNVFIFLLLVNWHHRDLNTGRKSTLSVWAPHDKLFTFYTVHVTKNRIIFFSSYLRRTTGWSGCSRCPSCPTSRSSTWMVTTSRSWRVSRSSSSSPGSAWPITTSRQLSNLTRYENLFEIVL